MVGEVLSDRYELEELVGTGGMSSVFRAHDRLLDRKVALKVLHEQYMADEDYVERFRREARAVAALSHPNIVTVIDRGEHNGRQFIVFEYVAGENLKQLISRRGPAPVTTAIELGIQIARALSFAHQQGLVHRDVKPQNVLLNGEGEAKVTDFGIARSLDVQHGMTQTGTVLGTSDYIAPEQAQGQRVDEQTDVYSLGVVLYELLTSEVPFPGENFVAVAMRHINEEPPSIREKRPDVSPRLEAAIHRAMAKDAAARFATMADFCHELELCLAEAQGTQVLPAAQPRRAASSRRRRRGLSPWPLILLLVALLAIGAVVAALLIHGNGSASETTTSGGAGGGAAPHLRAVAADDRFGTGGEHDAEVGRATDNDASTYWTTEDYRTAPDLGKPGVGLVLDAGRPVELRELGVATGTPGFTAVVRAGSSPTTATKVISSSQTVDDGTTFELHGGAAYRYYEVWITRLGSSYRKVQLNEVRAS
jgi:tRNA A-37 threonylcarbamoyl transferase component Bud32